MNKKLLAICIGSGLVIVAIIIGIVLWAKSGISVENYPKTETTLSAQSLGEKITQEILKLKTEKEAKELVKVSEAQQVILDLSDGTADIIYMYEPSKEILDWLDSSNVEIEKIPVAKDALVFISYIKNKINDISLDNLRNIYSGKVTNWKDIGGDDLAINAYQADPSSDAQYLLKSIVGEELRLPKIRLRDNSFEGIAEAVGNYSDTRDKALGFGLFSELDEIDKEKLNIITTEGYSPIYENIENGAYPLTGYIYAVIRKDEPKNSKARKVIEFLLSEEGQQAIKDSGYISID